MSKHDLSANEAKISFDLLLQVANIAVYSARTECERNLGRFQTESFKSNYSDMKYAARDLARSAHDLATATDTLHVLIESQSRDEVTLIK